ncbi:MULTISPECIES: nitroreductase family deazaflavin-dependent oxidoreductase [Streptomyces]|uniref:Nitroreductase family deazaflavin-dependent oxidoreductase n=1 Tax=Streptomyces galilaeus TaxID=33899 RepID=A0ABW9IK14_STRGJ
MTRFRSSRPKPSSHPGVRLVQKVSSTPAFAKVAPHLIPALDRAVHRLTRGKVLVSAQLLPGLVLTATGARSGQPRRTPLACMPEEDGGWILIGSNFGRSGHPAWTANLLARPDAEVSWKGADIPVTARLLTGEERAAVWKAALAFWPPYATYQARVEREIRLFRLSRREPAAGPAETPRSPASPPPTSG